MTSLFDRAKKAGISPKAPGLSRKQRRVAMKDFLRQHEHDSLEYLSTQRATRGRHLQVQNKKLCT